ncbi:MAG: adenylate/guanylate cyclase domain-containing protein [Armatimonadota bacterium]
MEDRQSSRTLIVAVTIGLLIGLAAAYMHSMPLLWRMELMTYDWRLPAYETSSNDEIVIVAIDNESIDSLQNWPWPRSFHARTIRTLADAGAKAIGVDIIFSDLSNTESLETSLDDPDAWMQEPEPSAEDRKLLEAIREAGNVILAAEIAEEDRKTEDLDAGMTTGNFPHWRFEEHAVGIGLVNFARDTDGVIRRMSLSREFLGDTYPSFAVALARSAQDVSIPESPAHPYVPSNTIPIAYRGAASTFTYVPYYQVLENRHETGVFQDKIVLIGATAPVLQDIHLCPLQSSRGRGMPGVEIQANSVATLLSGPHIQPLPVAATWVLCVILSLGVAVATGIWRPLRVLPMLVVPVLILVGAGTTLSLQSYHLWIPLVAPAAGIMAAYVLTTVYMYVVEEGERRRIRRAWEKRVARDVLDVILDAGPDAYVNGRRTVATVLFSDIRGFTQMCDTLEPEEVVEVLNVYLQRMTEVITARRGTLHKFIGDGIMAVFGDPVPYEDHADQAVRAAVEMHEALQELRHSSEKKTVKDMRMGVGIHTGELVAGDIGSEDFMEYTTIGRTVSIAARLEGENKTFGTGIIISEDTERLLQDDYPLAHLGDCEIRGVADPISLYAVEIDGYASETDANRGEQS